MMAMWSETNYTLERITTLGEMPLSTLLAVQSLRQTIFSLRQLMGSWECLKKNPEITKTSFNQFMKQ